MKVLDSCCTDREKKQVGLGRNILEGFENPVEARK